MCIFTEGTFDAALAYRSGVDTLREVETGGILRKAALDSHEPLSVNGEKPVHTFYTIMMVISSTNKKCNTYY